MQGQIVDVAWLRVRSCICLLSLVLVTMIIIHSLPRFTTVAAFIPGGDCSVTWLGDLAGYRYQSGG